MPLAALFWTAYLLAFCFCISAASAGEVAGEEAARKRNDTDEMERAFKLGMGRASKDGAPAEILILTYGRTLLMKGAIPGRGIQEELSCLLCTKDEALTAARGLGAALAAKSGLPKPEEEVDLHSGVVSGGYDRAARITAAAVVGGLGLGAVATGSIFLWLDGNCSTNMTDPATGRCAEDHELTAPGLALVIGGALAETLLIWLLWPDSDDSIEMRGKV